MITGVNHFTIASVDVECSFKFYRDTLGFKPLCKWDKGAYLLVGDFWFCINYDEKYKAQVDYTHIAFNVSSHDFDKLKRHITTNEVPIFKDNISEGDSLYFLDPDGHKLEIHVGNWQNRIAHKKSNPGNWTNVEFFI